MDQIPYEPPITPNDTPIPVTPPPVMSPAPIIMPTPPRSPLVPILIGICVITLGIAGYLGYQAYQLNQQITKASPSPTSSTVSTEKEDPTTDWKTYTNTKYNFSLKYPDNYNLRSYAGDNTSTSIETATSFVIEGPYSNLDTLTDSPERAIGVRVISVNPTDCRGDCPIIDTSTPVTIDNIDAQKITGYIGGIGGNIPHRYINYIFPIKNNFLELSLTPSRIPTDPNEIVPLSPQDESIFNQILSTLKFTNPTTSQPTSTATKSYTANGVSFNYPEIWSMDSSGKKFYSTSPKITLTIFTKDEPMMNECMETTLTETKNSIYIKKYQRVSTGEMCGGGNNTEREVWLTKESNGFQPGIIIEYFSIDSSKVEATINELVSTLKFTE